MSTSATWPRRPSISGGRVLEDGVRIYSANEPERVALECYILAHYHDYKGVFAEMHALRLRRLAERGR